MAGGAIAWLLFNGNDFVTGDVFGQIAGHLRVGTSLIAEGIAWAAVIGFWVVCFRGSMLRACQSRMHNAWFEEEHQLIQVIRVHEH